MGIGLLRAALACAALVSCATATATERSPAAPEVGKVLPAWTRGELDIHHISTGRGEAQLLILPDGTSLLVDTSGKTVERPPFTLPSRPDGSRPPGEWVARYVQRVLPPPAGKIDYALLTHFHGDHMGAVVDDSPRSRAGDYRLSGITEIADHVPIATIIDRGWPQYDYPAPIDTPTMDNYRRFLAWQVANRGLAVERFEPGRNDQLGLVHDPEAFPSFEIRNLYANGVVWSGVGNSTRRLFPTAGHLGKEEFPGENKLSIAFRVSYGKFDYFTGGDLSAIDEETAYAPAPWKDVETPVAQASGPVDVMKANHHGSWDANSIPFLAKLRPRVIVVPARADGHPAVNTWRRMTSTRVWPGPRDIFITNLSAATATTTYGVEQARGGQGHEVHQLMADYQSRGQSVKEAGGAGAVGDGWLRLLEFDLDGERPAVQVRTYSTHYQKHASEIPQYAEWYKRSDRQEHLTDAEFLGRDEFRIELTDFHRRFGR